jgi:hypothetical protein
MTNDAQQNSLIRRLIVNQRDDHTPHAFRAGHAGMQDFNRLVPLLRRLPAEEISQWLDLIGDVAASHRHCPYCLGKIIAYSIIITKDLEPLAIRHAGYMKQYERLLADQLNEEPRDFITEVIDSMCNGKEHPHRKLHAAHWHEIAEALRSSSRHQLDKDGPLLSRSQTKKLALLE